jgi:6-phosphogluconolactonase (cycloisomerase 2 family)
MQNSVLLRTAIAALVLALAGCAEPAMTRPSLQQSHNALATPGKVVVYGSEGAVLRQYALDLSTGQLIAESSVSLPVPPLVVIQYAAADRMSAHLYISASNGGASPQLFAMDIDPASGSLASRPPALVPAGGRIINLSVNHQGTHLALAHNVTNQVAIMGLSADGSLTGEIAQSGSTATGPFPHQAKFDQDGHNLVVPGLALNGGDGTLTVFRFVDGQLTRTQTLTFPPGLAPRHLDYASSGRFVYVALERGNRLYSYGFENNRLSETPLFDQTTLEDPANTTRLRQRAGAIHVHPNGRFLYVSNRADAVDASNVFAGGENNIAVFSLDAATGQPTAIQHIDTRGIEARSFTIDPTGQYLVVGNQVPRTTAAGPVPRSLAVFRIGDDGRLTFVDKTDITGGDVFWVGSLQLPPS